MRKRLSATAILVALALVPLWALPAAASPVVGNVAHGTISVGEEGECPESGQGSVWGYSYSDSWGSYVTSDEAFYDMQSEDINMVDGSGFRRGYLTLCGQLSREAANPEDAALGLGSICHDSLEDALENEPSRRMYYGHSGQGQLHIWGGGGDERTVQIQNVAFAPSATGILVARGDYADDPGTPGGTTGKVIARLHLMGNGMGGSCLQDWPSNVNLVAEIALVPEAIAE